MITKTDVYTYTEPETQYESYDLSTAEYVTAEYIPAVNPLHTGNPFIEALPRPKNAEESISSYTFNVPFNRMQIEEASNLEKLQTLSILQHIRFPLPFTAELEYEMYRALCESYASRHQFYNPNVPLELFAFSNNEYTYGKVIANQSSASVRGFSLIGNSGSGKSSAIEMLVSHYPQVIKHPLSSARITQIVYLVVDCPPNSNFNQLYISIAAAFDKALERTDNYYEDTVTKISGLSKKYTKIKRLIETFAVGIIIFDEIQQLDFHGIRENTFESLLTLSNETKVAIAAVGTEDALNKMFPNERTARRVGSFIHASTYCDNFDFFKILVQRLSRYYWFDSPLALTDDIFQSLLKYSNGIIAHLITIYTYMNVDYINAKTKPEINVEFIDSVIARHFSGLSKLLSKNRRQKQAEETSSEIMQRAHESLVTLMQPNKQQRFMDALINTNETSNASRLLANVIKNIQLCHPEYTADSITTTFNKIYNSKHQDASEEEITRLVVVKLQKVSTPKVVKGIKPSPDEIRMNLASAYQTNKESD